MIDPHLTGFGLTDLSHALSGWPRAIASGGTDGMAFFALLKEFLDSEIVEYSNHLLRRVGRLCAWIVTPLVVLWISYQGFIRVSGRSHESMSALTVDAGRIALITLIAGMAAGFQPATYKALTDGVSQTINWTISGNDTVSVYDDIDQALALTQLAMASIDLLDVGDDPVAMKRRDTTSLMAGLGVGGPAVVGGTLLILNKFVMALLIGTGPFFILCLIFKQTEGLFKGWLNSLLGTLMSLAFLSVAVTLAMDITLALAGSFWATEGLSRWFGMGSASEGISGVAQMQGITGLVLTALILSAPPAAAMLFRGLLANFNPYPSMGGPGAGAASPAHSAYAGPAHGNAAAARAQGGPDLDSRRDVFRNPTMRQA